MKRILFLRIVIPLLCICLLPVQLPAQTGGPIISKSEVALVISAIAAAGAAIGIGVYYAFHHSHSIRGCVVTGSNGLQLQNEGDQRTFLLQGITANVKSGNRVSVKGKKVKDGSGEPTFLVEKLAKDFGKCKVAPASP